MNDLRFPVGMFHQEGAVTPEQLYDASTPTRCSMHGTVVIISPILLHYPIEWAGKCLKNRRNA